MPQESLSSTTQSIGAAGPLILSYIDPTGARPTVSVSFIPTNAKMVRPQPSPLQHVNVSMGGTIHVFELSRNEPLQWLCEFTDLPYADDDPFQPVPTQGYRALISFIRYTLSYSMNPAVVTTPDGAIETMIYLGGIETFQEAAGQTSKVRRWAGQVTFSRKIT